LEYQDVPAAQKCSKRGNQIMIIHEPADYIKYRFNRAKETFEEALLMANNGHWNTAINRLYYSCFYAVVALLLKRNLEAKTLEGVRNQFSLHFIKTGEIQPELGTFFSRLNDLRIKGDYGDLFNFGESDVKPLIEPVEKFIKEIEKLVTEYA
jgi:uncharacterized protein (UPF0332 family)